MMGMEGWGWLVTLLIAGTLATDFWRVLGVFAALRVDEGSEVFQFARAISTALVAALIARLVFFPPGSLAAVPLMLRVVAFAAGLTVYFVARRSIALGIIAGEVVLVCGFFLAAHF